MAATSDAEDASAGTVHLADLSLTKADSPDPVQEDAVLTYTIRVRNAGPADATNVAVSDDLPSQVDPLSADASAGNCEIQGKQVSCELGTIRRGSATVTIRVRPRKMGQITNTASVESDVTDPQTANNEDAESTTVTRAPEAATCKNRAVTVLGTSASDKLTGTSGKDVIFGGGGNDGIDAAGAKDLICAGDGDDLILAGGGNDFVKAQAGRDAVKAQAGGDTVRGGRNRDGPSRAAKATTCSSAARAVIAARVAAGGTRCAAVESYT